MTGFGDGAGSGLPAELGEFMCAYELASNSHDVDRVTPLIAADATYWFSDGCYRGRAAIAAALSRTFAVIQNEVYEITDLEWIAVAESLAACRYRFSWWGTIDGQPRCGTGRGTSVLVRHGTTWHMQHQHLSD